MLLLFYKLGRWWAATAWPWLKANWKWVILFPVMLVVWLSGKRSGAVTVTNDDHESNEAEAYRDQVEAQAAAKVEALDVTRKERVKAVVAEHKETIEQLNRDQQAQADELLEDPEELNSFLLNVGRRQRD